LHREVLAYLAFVLPIARWGISSKEQQVTDPNRIYVIATGGGTAGNAIFNSLSLASALVATCAHAQPDEAAKVTIANTIKFIRAFIRRSPTVLLRVARLHCKFVKLEISIALTGQGIAALSRHRR
jgi:hypothetical protein